MSQEILIKTIPFATYCLCYGSFIWGFTFYFKRKGDRDQKRVSFIGILGFILMGATLWPMGMQTSGGDATLILGIVLGWISIVLFWSTVGSHKKNPPLLAFSKESARTFNHSGPYRFIRHPFYTSYSIAWIGALFATEAWYLVVPTVLMIGLYVSAARLEESQFLNSEFKDQYQAYRSKTGMFFPGF